MLCFAHVGEGLRCLTYTPTFAAASTSVATLFYVRGLCCKPSCNCWPACSTTCLAFCFCLDHTVCSGGRHAPACLLATRVIKVAVLLTGAWRQCSPGCVAIRSGLPGLDCVREYDAPYVDRGSSQPGSRCCFGLNASSNKLLQHKWQVMSVTCVFH